MLDKYKRASHMQRSRCRSYDRAAGLVERGERPASCPSVSQDRFRSISKELKAAFDAYHLRRGRWRLRMIGHSLEADHAGSRLNRLLYQRTWYIALEGTDWHPARMFMDAGQVDVP